ncbi:MAG: hypothetical protein ACW990_20630 [Promethearchaeota archaeon]|jgi:hypothetical protein
MYFENIKKGHNKWYQVDLIPGPPGKNGEETGAVIARWGKMGNPKYRQQQKFVGEWIKATRVFNEICKKRYSHGYKKVDKKME